MADGQVDPGREDQTKRRRPWFSRYRFGSASRNLHISCIKELFSSALRDRIIAVSPAAHLRSAKARKTDPADPTFEQFKAIIADVRAQPFNADAQDSADFFEFLGLAGLGQAEAGSLTRADVDFEAADYHVSAQDKHRLRNSHLSTSSTAIGKLCEGKAHGGRVFKICDAKKALAGACRRLGYPPFSQRSLRRMFITRAIERGVDVKVIAEWQGHSDGGKLILDTYSHVNPIHSQRMAQADDERRTG